MKVNDRDGLFAHAHEGRWGSRALSSCAERGGSDDGVARAIACLAWHTQDIKEEQPHTSAPTVCAHLIRFSNTPRRCDSSSIVFATNPRQLMQWFQSQLFHGGQPGACSRDAVGNKRWWAIDVEVKLHSQTGRSSSLPRGVVATSRSGARMKFEAQPGWISNNKAH
jgi:hypothetical protein